ncbi:MAG: hypothetical protein KF819_24735 [Labilithrix sp.]|nr:hypothetical protein [Labilithrix sp.]
MSDTCGAEITDGGSCNDVRDVGVPVMPTCLTGDVPAGSGGTIEDGTYVLVAQTYYNVPRCPTSQVTATVLISGGCFQLVGHSVGGNHERELRGSMRVTTKGTRVVEDATCVPPGGRSDAPRKTFTAVGSKLMMFTANAGTDSSNPDRVEVLERR